MRRREFIALTAGATVIWPFASAAQEVGRTYRLGILAPFPRQEPASLPFFNELPRRGFIEGQNLTIYYRDFGPHVDLISEYAAELVKNRVDVIWGAGGAAVRATQQNDSNIRNGRRHGWGGTGGLAGPAKRQYNGPQYLRR